jgi:PilZ domain-containing protein
LYSLNGTRALWEATGTGLILLPKKMLSLFPQKELEQPREKTMPVLRTAELAANKVAPATQVPQKGSAQECAPAQGAATKQPERRQMRRAGISLLVRIRTADFTDGNFEEVRTTQNASRKAVYFVTHVDRYYKGMRVRITSPYDPNNGSGNLEQMGEVVRVHRKEVGYGVAIALTCSPQAAAATPSSYAQGAPAGTTASPYAHPSVDAPVSQHAQSFSTRHEQGSAYAPSERRSANRAPFIAPVDLVDVRTGTRIQARTSDLSAQGCYIDTLNPLPVGSMVRLQIHRSDKVLDAIAHVSSRHAGSGMGLVFSELSVQQKNLLAMWLTELALPPSMVFPDPAPVKSTKTPDFTLDPQDRATRVIQLLLRKGVLNQSEANELLNEPE